MSLLERLQTFLEHNGQPADVELLTADASTREYFRVEWNGEKAVACVYPEDGGGAAATYIDTTQLFTRGGLPVARVIFADVDAGIVTQEDLGDRILRNELTREPDKRIDDAIGLIVRIQKATDLAFETNAIASTLRFDTEKLLWELNYFREHYFDTYKKKPLSEHDNANLLAEFEQLSGELDARASVLCHRDFHAANLMIDMNGELRIIDHQDARIGSVAYDLVSLLLDRVEDPPRTAWLAEKKAYFLEQRDKAGLPKLDAYEFEIEFELQTVQRCLKATGTFSYQSVKRGKTYFIPYIQPMLQIAVGAAKRLKRFAAVEALLEN